MDAGGSVEGGKKRGISLTSLNFTKKKAKLPWKPQYHIIWESLRGEREFKKKKWGDREVGPAIASLLLVSCSFYYTRTILEKEH